MQQPIFVVGTGRCGSTLLSNILAQSPHVLSLSEFFVSLGPRAFEKEVLDGVELWSILSTPRLKTTLMLRHGVDVPEILYKSNTEVPPILMTTLPHISDEPDELLEGVREFVWQLPEDASANQYLKLFGWLQERFNKRAWVERSGGSLRYVENLRKLYPNAKFVHIYRDGRECAMSMSQHSAFRLAIIQAMIQEAIGLDPFAVTIPLECRGQLGDLARLLPDQFDVEAFESFDIPIECFGMLWSTEIVKGLRSLNNIPRDNLLNIRYEDILKEPEEHILRFMSFVLPSFDDSEFVQRMAKTVHTDKKLTWVHLEADERERLSQACSIGLRLLGYQ